MELDLDSDLVEIFNSYTLFKLSERFVLFHSNMSLVKPLIQKISVKKPKTVNTPIVIDSNPACSRPKTIHYLQTEINFMATDRDELSYIPYDDYKNQVYTPENLDIHYPSNPFNVQQRESKIIENDQFLEYLTLSLYKIHLEPSIWIKVGTKVADLLKKDRRELMSKMSGVIKNAITGPERYLKVPKYKDNFCRVCKTYSCLAHFSERGVTYEHDNSKYKNTAENSSKYNIKAFKELDPEG